MQSKESTPIAMHRDPETGFWVFDVPSDAPQFSLEDVQRVLDDEDLECVKHFHKG